MKESVYLQYTTAMRCLDNSSIMPVYDSVKMVDKDISAMEFVVLTLNVVGPA